MNSRGFTLLEVVVAMTLSLLLAAGVTTFVAALARAGLEHPRRADEQQRLRAAWESLALTVSPAGQGLEGRGDNEGWLLVPPLYPQRRGVSPPDAELGAWDDRLTVVSATVPSASATLAVSMASRAADLELDTGRCGAGVPACGFVVGERAFVADGRAWGEWFRVDGIAGPAVAHWPASLSATYGPDAGAVVTGADVRAVAFDPVRRQLRLLTPGSDLPLIDGVASFRIEWLGDPRPPGGPRPAPGETNCVIDAAGLPRLPMLSPTDGPWVVLSSAQLSDGPWCGVPPWRYDADLFRVRLLRIRLGLDPTPLAGAVWELPPQRQFAIAPRNLWRLR